MSFSNSSSDSTLLQEDGTHAVPIRSSRVLKDCKSKIIVLELTDDEIEFEVIGWPNHFLNSVRRSIISKVSTLAIDRIEILKNSSIIFDEMLSQRLGLVPIRADPRKYEFKTHASDQLSHKNSIVFNMDVKCSADVNLMTVYSKDLKWIPHGKEEFEEEDVPTPVPDIEIAKLIPGQEINLNAICLKGCGCEHSKFNPAANVRFKPMVELQFVAPVQDQLAHKLKAIVDSGVEVKKVKGVDTAIVKNPLSNHNYWKIMEDEQLKKLINVSFSKNNFLFTTEGVGCMPAKIMVEEGIKLIRDSYKSLLDALSDI